MTLSQAARTVACASVHTPSHHRTKSLVDRGQAAVEFAIGLPIVLIAVLAIAQVAVFVRDQLALEAAAREAARAASVSTDLSSAAATGRSATSVTGIEVRIADNGGTVTATATLPARGLPIVGAAVSGRTHTASVTMLIEPP